MSKNKIASQRVGIPAPLQATPGDPKDRCMVAAASQVSEALSSLYDEICGLDETVERLEARLELVLESAYPIEKCEEAPWKATSAPILEHIGTKTLAVQVVRRRVEYLINRLAI